MKWPKCLYRTALSATIGFFDCSSAEYLLVGLFLAFALLCAMLYQVDVNIGLTTDLEFKSVFLFCFGRMRSTLKALEEKIVKEGKVLPGNILKVGTFLNHQVDAEFTLEMGKEIARLYEGEKIDRVLTIETSGITIALGAAVALHVPMVFAKKNRSGNLSGDLYKTVVHSYTHGTDYTVVVEKQYINKGERVLIVDDFLANGKALVGLCQLVEMAGATPVGAAVAIEKGFQHGGDELRKNGLRIESLAIIESMEDGNIVFRN